MEHNVLIGLSYETRFFITKQLNTILASQITLYMKFLNFHWNVTGKHFGPLHLLFKEGYELLFNTIDDTAERCVQLGFPALGTLQSVLDLSPIQEHSGATPSADEMVSILNNNLSQLITFIREITLHVEGATYHDSGTANFLSGMMERYEKLCWMIRAHIV